MEKHIVFDCDGTLIDPPSAYLVKSKLVLEKLEGINVSLEELSSLRLRNPEDIFNHYIKKSTVSECLKEWSRLSREPNNHFYPLFDGIYDLVKKLSEEGAYIYVWTARERRSTLAILKRLGIMPYVIDMRCYDDGLGKPHPQGMYDLVGHVSKKEVLLIGDTINDVEGAKNFGCEIIGALWSPEADKESLENKKCQLFARSIDECYEVIQNYYSQLVD